MAEKKVKSISCDIPFPISRFDLINQFGNCKIEFTNGDVAYVHNFFGDVEIDEFDSEGELKKVIQALIV